MADFNADPNPMPEIKLGIAELVCDLLGRYAMLPNESITFLSGHYTPPVEDDPQATLDLED